MPHLLALAERALNGSRQVGEVRGVYDLATVPLGPQVRLLDHHLRKGYCVLQAVLSRVASGRAGSLYLVFESVLVLHGLFHRVLDVPDTTVEVNALEPAREPVSAHSTALHLEHERASLRVHDDEVGLSVLVEHPPIPLDPLHAVEHNVLRRQLALQLPVQRSLSAHGHAIRQALRIHPRHRFPPDLASDPERKALL